MSRVLVAIWTGITLGWATFPWHRSDDDDSDPGSVEGP